MESSSRPVGITGSAPLPGRRQEFRTLFLVNGVPYPPIGGSRLRDRQNIEVMRRRGPVFLISLVSSRKKASKARGAPPYVEFYLKPRRGLIDAVMWPIGDRARQWWRERMIKRRARRLAHLVPRKIAEFEPHLIVFEWPQAAAYVAAPEKFGAKVIYDAHVIEAIMSEIMPDVRKDGMARADRKLQMARDCEARLVPKVDQVWVCSARDRALLGGIYGLFVDARVIPNGIDVEHYAKTFERRVSCASGRSENGTSTVLFPATFGYHLNVASARFLIEDILPVLQKSVPNVEVVLCGDNPPEEILAYGRSITSVVVTGRVLDTRRFFERCDVVVVPLMHGGGTRLKILEALAMGCPVVSTSKGAEGLDVIDGVHLLIADTAEAIATQISRCLNDRSLTSRLASEGRAFVEAHYSWKANAGNILDAVSSIVDEQDKALVSIGRTRR